MVPICDPSVSILVINSNVKHELTGSEYSSRRQQCTQAAQILQTESLRNANIKLLEGNIWYWNIAIAKYCNLMINWVDITFQSMKNTFCVSWQRFNKITGWFKKNKKWAQNLKLHSLSMKI